MRNETVIQIECVCGKHKEMPMPARHGSQEVQVDWCPNCGRRWEIDLTPWNRREASKAKAHDA